VKQLLGQPRFLMFLLLFVGTTLFLLATTAALTNVTSFLFHPYFPLQVNLEYIVVITPLLSFKGPD
jgi:hypothetical protein